MFHDPKWYSVQDEQQFFSILEVRECARLCVQRGMARLVACCCSLMVYTLLLRMGAGK